MSTLSMLRRAALVSTVVVAAAASPSGASTMRTTGHDVGSMKPFGKPPSARIAPRHERLSHLSHAVTGIPFHQLGAQFCDGGQIRITVPQAVYPWYAGTRE